MTPDDGAKPDALPALLALLRAENATLRERLERQSRIAGAATDYVYSVRLEGGRAVETRHGPGCQALTGYTCEELKSLSVSGYAEDVLARHGDVAPGFRLLQKLFTVQGLARKVREALDT